MTFSEAIPHLGMRMLEGYIGTYSNVWEVPSMLIVVLLCFIECLSFVYVNFIFQSGENDRVSWYGILYRPAI